MKLYQKIDENGISHVMPKNKIVIIKDGMQIFNPTEKIILSDGWKIYKPKITQLTNEELINNAKNVLIDNIISYDSSDNVNMFYVQNQPVWLDKATRAGLMLRFQAEITTNVSETTLWYNSVEFKLTPQYAMQMLYQIEIYASKCYDKTQYHIAQVKSLTTIEEIENYNYKIGYPDKLYF